MEDEQMDNDSYIVINDTSSLSLCDCSARPPHTNMKNVYPKTKKEKKHDVFPILMRMRLEWDIEMFKKQNGK